MENEIVKIIFLRIIARNLVLGAEHSPWRFQEEVSI